MAIYHLVADSTLTPKKVCCKCVRGNLTHTWNTRVCQVCAEKQILVLVVCATIWLTHASPISAHTYVPLVCARCASKSRFRKRMSTKTPTKVMRNCHVNSYSLVKPPFAKPPKTHVFAVPLVSSHPVSGRMRRADGPLG